ncbi:hypothetical protein ACFQE1_03280 [Halobium palmae]|uniref:Uncharacterized protein n=1 Tax=Halobium palmae TaxID=1776492 RepID=A0ABD5RVJ6_9EURY
MRSFEPTPVYPLRQLLAVTGVFVAVIAAVLFAASYPTLVLAALAGAGIAMVSTVVAVDLRRRRGRTRRIVIPGTNVAFEA